MRAIKELVQKKSLGEIEYSEKIDLSGSNAKKIADALRAVRTAYAVVVPSAGLISCSVVCCRKFRHSCCPRSVYLRLVPDVREPAFVFRAFCLSRLQIDLAHHSTSYGVLVESELPEIVRVIVSVWVFGIIV